MKKLIGLLAFMMLLGLGVSNAQTKKVTGTVTDKSDGSPLPGVSVAVKGTNQGTATDIDGKYTITVTPNDVLIFSFVGMQPQEIKVGGKTVINVKLVSSRVAVEEVVVTALGIKRSEKAIGYAATTVKSDEITATKKSDVISSLSGKVAGVQISSNSSDPGASTSVIIRGISSLSGNNQPLYVIDGVPLNNSVVDSDDELNNGFDYGNGANLVNPDDVESVTILKGAAATALYGSRASNGVVLITTKTGKVTKGIGVTINSSVEFSDFLRLPDFQNQYGMGWNGEHTLIENGSWGPRFDGRLHLWGTVYDPDNSQKLKPFSAQPNNVKEFFDFGLKYQNSVSLSGGDDKSTFYASFSNVKDDGMIPDNRDTYKKNTFSLKTSRDFDVVKLSASINYGDQKNNFAPTGQGLTMINSLYQIPRDISIIGLENYRTDPFDTQDYYFTPYGVTNPYYILDNTVNEYRAQKIYGKVQADLKIDNNISLTYRFGLDATDNETKQAMRKIEASIGSPNEGQVDQGGNVYKQMQRRRELNHDLFATYNNKFDDISLGVVVGLNANERNLSILDAEVKGLDIPTYFDLSNSAGTPDVDEYKSKRRLIGLYGQAEVSYDEFLYLTLTARNDWSSTLPKNNRSFFYPGATLSFLFTKYIPENISDIITFGKARIAYGRTGNDANVYLVDPYYLKTIVHNRFGDIKFPLKQKIGDDIVSINAYEYGNVLGNPSLSPEISTEFEVGLNFALWDGRVVFDGAYYNKKSDKQIFQLGMDPASGFNSQNINLGEVENQGVELLLSFIPVKYEGFQWEVTLNYTKNKSKVLSLPDEMGDEITLYSFGTSNATTSLVAREGHEIGEFKVTMPKTSPDGKIIASAKDGMPVADSDLQYFGSINPDFEMGISNKFSYKGLSLAFDIDIRDGGLMYSRTKDILYFTGNAEQTLWNDRRPFIVPNSVNEIENPDGSFSYVENTTPIVKNDIWTYYQNGKDKLNAEFLIPRSFVKLRNVVIGYDLPKRWYNELPIESIRVSAYATNLAVWTPRDNSFIDPELTSFGNDLLGKFGEYSANPTTKRFGFNLQVKF